MSSRELTTKLNDIPIVDVAALLGVKLLNSRGVRCPLPHHDDVNPSFQVRPNGVYWVCYGCNKRGGSIDFVKEYLSLSFLEAKNWLNGAYFGGDVSFKKLCPSVRHNRKTTAKTVTASHDEEARPDSRLYEAFLKQHPLLLNGKTYLLGRCISESTMEKFRVGQVDKIVNTMGNLIVEFGFDRVQSSGLLTSKSVKSNWRCIFSDGSLLFPYLENGSIVYYQSRILSETGKGSRWRNLYNRRHQLYNVDSLQEKVSKIAICEGVIDTLSAIEIGYSAVGLIGAGACFTQNNILSLIGKNVDILLDWDEQGEVRSKKLVRELRSHGVAAVRKQNLNNSINDLNDFLVKESS